MAHEPTDAELAEFRDWSAEPDFIADAIANHRDLWTMLFSVDQAFGPSCEDDST